MPVKKKQTNKKPTTKKTFRQKKSGKASPWWLRYVLFSLIGLIIVGGGFYWFFIKPYAYRWKPCYGRLAYGVCIPCEYEVHGIDISHYQGRIDWAELYKNKDSDFPLKFIFMKATEGSDLPDETFAQNFDSAKTYGFIRGAYHFFVPTSDARSQADFYIRNVQLKEGDLPPVLDVETKVKDKSALQRSVKAWLDAVEAHYGVKPILYTSYKYKESYLDNPIFDAYPYWIAHYYVDSVKYRGHWEFWQHTDIGEVPGIEGDVDLNVFNGSLQDLSKYTLTATD